MKIIPIGHKKVGQGNPCIISFELGATFENVETAKKMIKTVSDSGADAIKFQTILPGESERLMAQRDLMVSFSTPTGKKQESVLEALRRRELPKESWKELADYAKRLGLLFITTIEFPDSVSVLEEMKVDAIKIAKGDINNVLLIERVATTGLPVILDGREKFEDVERAVEICENNHNNNIIIMHCPSGYPVEHSGVHLNAIKTIQAKYDYPIGFADHSVGGIMNYAAIALGVSMLEKTITVDKTIEHVEHYMSLELEELSSFVQNVRAVEQAMGDPNILFVSRVEESARRSIVAKEDIMKGQRITRSLLDFKRPGNIGISCSEGFNLLNKVARTNIPKNTPLQWDMLD